MSFVNIDNNEFDTGKFKVQVGPNRRIDPSNGYVFFSCEAKDGDDTTLLAILKTKRGDLIYPAGNEHNSDLINSLMIKTNEILDSTEAIYKSDLAPETLNNEVVTFIKQDLDPTNEGNTVMNFGWGDIGNAISNVGNAIGNTVKSGLEAVGRGAYNAGEAVAHAGEKVIQAGKVAVDIGRVMVTRTENPDARKNLDELNGK
ncbi:hypothetical protein M1D47_09205 [Bacillus sp. R1-10]